jgi:hypothetical protein
VVDRYRYLGVVLHHMGEWLPHLNDINKRFRFRLRNMRAAGMQRDGLPPHRGRLLVWAEFCPLWEYACAAFTLTQQELDFLDARFNEVVRSAAGVARFVSIEAILYDMDLLQAIPSQRICMYRIVLWRRILQMDESRWVRRAAMMWKSAGAALQARGIRKALPGTYWLSMLTKDMRQMKFTDEQLIQHKVDTKFKEVLKERLFLCKIQPQWRLDMATKPHLRQFAASVPDVSYEERQFEVISEAGMEPELIKVTVRKKCSTFAAYLDDGHRRRRQFRLTWRAGCLPLQCALNSNTRYRRRGGVAADDSCWMCRDGLENEQHFVNECTAYVALRNQAQGVWVSDRVSGMLYEMWALRQRRWRASCPSAEARDQVRSI